jgi:hypothetical protein
VDTGAADRLPNIVDTTMRERATQRSRVSYAARVREDRLRRDLILVRDATLGPGELDLLDEAGWAAELLRRRPASANLRG